MSGTPNRRKRQLSKALRLPGLPPRPVYLPIPPFFVCIPIHTGPLELIHPKLVSHPITLHVYLLSYHSKVIEVGKALACQSYVPA